MWCLPSESRDSESERGRLPRFGDSGLILSRCLLPFYPSPNVFLVISWLSCPASVLLQFHFGIRQLSMSSSVVWFSPPSSTSSHFTTTITVILLDECLSLPLSPSTTLIVPCWVLIAPTVSVSLTHCATHLCSWWVSIIQRNDRQSQIRYSLKITQIGKL